MELQFRPESEKLLMMDRGTLKHVEFYSKNKFEKLVHLVCFIIRILKSHGHIFCLLRNSAVCHKVHRSPHPFCPRKF